MDSLTGVSDANVLLAGHLARRYPPINLQAADQPLFSSALETAIPDTQLEQLSNVRISPEGYLFQGTRLLAESFASSRDMRGWKRMTRTINFLATAPRRTRTHFAEPVTWITDNWSTGYFHWMTDALPRLLALGVRIQETMLILPAGLQAANFVRDSLRPFKLSRIHVLQPGEVAVCDTLLLPNHTAPTGNYHEPLIRSLRQNYSESANFLEPSKFSHRIYISRSRAQRRKIANEAEVLSLLEEFQFQTVYFEDRSFEEQVQIAQHAKYLVANHGAGLTNMLFMQAGASVLELRLENDGSNNCYFSLASALELKYYYQTCAGENPDESSHMANLIVDIERLRQNLTQMLA